MRNFLLVLISLTFVSAGGYAQTSCNCFIFGDTTMQLVPMPLGTDTGAAPYYRCGDCSSAPIILPFSFCFYGKNYDTVYINNKGSLTFNKPVYNFSSTGFPAGKDTMMLAAMWADVNNRQAAASEIYYKITPTHMVVQWYNVGYQTFDNDLWDNFQITITNGADSILPPGNNVAYCYYVMRWQSADSSGGSGGFGGVPGVFGVNKGDGVHYAQFGLFADRGYSYYGPYDSNSQLYWLNYKSFIFSTCVTGNNIPPAILYQDTCVNDTVCVGDTLKFYEAFLCAQQGQKAVVTATSPGLSGLTSDTASAYSIYGISNNLVAQLKDTGAHVITITATDNSLPPLTNSILFNIFIKQCDTTLGINKLTTDDSKFELFPNPNNGNFELRITNYESRMNYRLEIYNVLGQKVYSNYQIINGAALMSSLNNGQSTNKSPNYQINLSSQPSGVYFYRLVDEAGNLLNNGKFVIQ